MDYWVGQSSPWVTSISASLGKSRSRNLGRAQGGPRRLLATLNGSEEC
ncbi:MULTISPECIES: hypothetical protein [unclassified Halomonas]